MIIFLVLAIFIHISIQYLIVNLFHSYSIPIVNRRAFKNLINNQSIIIFLSVYLRASKLSLDTPHIPFQQSPLIFRSFYQSCLLWLSLVVAAVGVGNFLQ